MAERQRISLAEATNRCTREDRKRKKYHRYFFGPAADQSGTFDLVVNSARVPLDDTVAMLRNLVQSPARRRRLRPAARPC